MDAQQLLLSAVATEVLQAELDHRHEQEIIDRWLEKLARQIARSEEIPLLAKADLEALLRGWEMAIESLSVTGLLPVTGLQMLTSGARVHEFTIRPVDGQARDGRTMRVVIRGESMFYNAIVEPSEVQGLEVANYRGLLILYPEGQAE